MSTRRFDSVRSNTRVKAVVGGRTPADTDQCASQFMNLLARPWDGSC